MKSSIETFFRKRQLDERTELTVKKPKQNPNVIKCVVGGVGVDCYYTRIEILHAIAQSVRSLITPNTSYVDFSCGQNDFAPLLGCPFKSFDVSPAPNAEVQDWLTVCSNQLPECTNLIIGLNPPFGYQGKTAKVFVEHAIKFNPQYMVLILPNMKGWIPEGYEIITRQPLPEDSFYDPGTGKSYKEISTTFFILKKNPSSKVLSQANRKQIKQQTDILVTRKWMPKKFPFIVLRRVGRNTTKQFYCVNGSKSTEFCYFDNGKCFPGVKWTNKQTKHAVESEYFLKIYFDEQKTLDELWRLCQLIYEHPEDGYKKRQPHAITNEYVYEMIQQWRNCKQ